jgi:hypothetical protein
VLLGEDRADKADQGIAAGEDPGDVGAAADLAVRALLRVVGPDFLRESRERQDVRAGFVEVGRDLRELLAEAVEDPAELGADRVGAGLVIDRVQQCPDAAPRQR